MRNYIIIWRNDMCLGLSPLSEKKLDVIKVERIYTTTTVLSAQKNGHI